MKKSGANISHGIDQSRIKQFNRALLEKDNQKFNETQREKYVDCKIRIPFEKGAYLQTAREKFFDKPNMAIEEMMKTVNN